ncbi:MAG: tetratricopeptide repeat protein [Verrucomicrobiota bacterium]
MGSNTTVAKQTNSPWLHGPGWDLIAGCGAWSLPIIALTTLLAASYRIELGAAFYFLSVFCNNPHYMATLHRAYGGKKEFNKYKVFSIYLTSLIAIAGASAHLAPALALWLVTIYLIWSPRHYTGQNFGIALTLSRRAGLTPSKDARNLLYLSYIGSYLVWVADIFETAPVGSFAIPLEIPPLAALSLRLVGYCLFLTAGAFAFALLHRQSKSLSQLLAPALLHFSQFLWFMLPSLVTFFTGAEKPSIYFSAGALAFMHCAQYLWITSYFAKKKAETATPPQKWSFLSYFSILAVGGIALFTPGPWLVSIIFQHDLFQSALIFTALVNIHHFMLDGAIWKLRDNRISRIFFGNPNTHQHSHDHESTPQIIDWLFSKQLFPRLIRTTAVLSLVGFAIADQSLNLLTLKGATKDQVSLAQRLNPHDSRVQLRLAEHLLREGQTDEAISILTNAIQHSPRNLALNHLLAHLYFQNNQVELTKTTYDQVLKIAPTDLSTLVNRALIAHSEKDWPLAIKLLESAAEKNLPPGHSHLLLAESLYKTAHYKPAIPYYQSYLEFASRHTDSVNPRDVIRSSNQLIECYRETNRHHEAEELSKVLSKLRLALR